MNVTHGLRRALQVSERGVATIFEGRKRTWLEIGDRVSRLAGALRAHGVGRGDRVAVLMLNQDRYIECYIAAGWAGAVIVPLNTRWSVRETAATLSDCGAMMLVVDRTFAEAAKMLAATAFDDLSLIYADDDNDTPAGMAAYETLIAVTRPMPDAMVSPDELAAIFYAGGETGRPRGVMLSHRNITANALAMLAEGLIRETSTYLHAAPMFQVVNASALYSLFLSGGTSVVVEAFEPEDVFDGIERYQVTETLLVPAMLQMAVEHSALRLHDLGSLKGIYCGGSPICGAALDRARAALPGVELTHGYGMSELSGLVAILHGREPVGERRGRGLRTRGRSTFGVEIRIVDEYDREAPRGVVGEICARGDVVMMGYWNRPEETGKAIVEDWMHTGDAGYMDEDGFIYLLDRVENANVDGGERLYTLEAENAVAPHSAVA